MDAGTLGTIFGAFAASATAMLAVLDRRRKGQLALDVSNPLKLRLKNAGRRTVRDIVVAWEHDGGIFVWLVLDSGQPVEHSHPSGEGRTLWNRGYKIKLGVGEGATLRVVYDSPQSQQYQSTFDSRLVYAPVLCVSYRAVRFGRRACLRHYFTRYNQKLWMHHLIGGAAYLPR
ncbi:MAG: hypothetical protein M3Y36_02570 [Actinomycetota bacterium]|nr:hypothetical protein [Actinomycetota bacterium]